MAIATHSSAHPKPAGTMRHAPTHHGARLAGEGRDVAVPGHRGHVLHRADRVVHRPPRRQPPQRLQQPLSARPRPCRAWTRREGRRHQVGGLGRARIEHDPPHRRRPEPRRDRRPPRAGRALGHAIVSELTPEKAETLEDELQLGRCRGGDRDRSRPTSGPSPTTICTNPLAINLTAGNTFILICSSVTMVLALSAIQRGNQVKVQRSSWLPPCSSARASSASRSTSITN